MSDTINLPGFKAALKAAGLYTYKFEEAVQKHHGGEMPRGHRSRIYDARRGQPIPKDVAEEFAKLLGVEVEALTISPDKPKPTKRQSVAKHKQQQERATATQDLANQERLAEASADKAADSAAKKVLKKVAGKLGLIL